MKFLARIGPSGSVLYVFMGMQRPKTGLKIRFCLTSSIMKRGSFYVRLHRPPSTSSERPESPECVTSVHPGEENASPALLSMRLPIIFGSRIEVPRGSLLASAGIISLPDLLQEPSTACKAGVDTAHLLRPDIRDGGKLLPVARLSVDAQGRSGWRITYPCVLLSICVHHCPKTTQKTSENWKRLSYNKPLQAGR